MVLIANDLQPERLKIAIALLIFLNLLGIGMIVPVDFDDERLFWAEEVYNVWANPMLTSELEPLNLSCPQLPPYLLLWTGHGRA
ncbi:MAG: hypothetical protein RI101_11185 [Nitrospira sp.]|jgi:predicted NBD/HSP70 family sugar kinase|nr:hypothetical protein [Nitrospira sp.]